MPPKSKPESSHSSQPAEKKQHTPAPQPKHSSHIASGTHRAPSPKPSELRKEAAELKETEEKSTADSKSE